MEERKSRPGWNQGLKYLVSENFQDMDKMIKPAFGMPSVVYSPRAQTADSEDSVLASQKERSETLWNCLTKNLLDPLTEGETRPYALKVWEERQKYQRRIFLQEFSRMHNLNL
jgi:hypothetical protein